MYNEGVSLLAAQSPIEALAAFTRAASFGHPAAHAAAAALFFEGAVACDGTVADSDFVKAYDMYSLSRASLITCQPTHIEIVTAPYVAGAAKARRSAARIALACCHAAATTVQALRLTFRALMNWHAAALMLAARADSVSHITFNLCTYT
jgi:hypothetical protein